MNKKIAVHIMLSSMQLIYNIPSVSSILNPQNNAYCCKKRKKQVIYIFVYPKIIDREISGLIHGKSIGMEQLCRFSQHTV